MALSWGERENLKRKISRKVELTRKWTGEAAKCRGDDAAVWATRKYCLGLARHAQEEKERMQRLLDGH
jgi:hypothetical protein